MHRRTMLLQSLIALSSGDGDPAAVATLTAQLADITVACDRLMENMLRVADQRAQIQSLKEIHIASALAMALRKLNGSYAKRTGELREARAQIEQLKGELEEAWRVAEDMAEEMDGLDNFHSGFSSDDDEYEEDPTMNDESVRLAEVINITGIARASKATLTNLNLPSPQIESDRASRVSAARKRSTRASKASLRIPKSAPSAPGSSAGTEDRASVFSRRSRSKSLRRATDETEVLVPPVPAVHLEAPTSAKEDSFLEMSETRPGSPLSPDPAQLTATIPKLPAGGVDEENPTPRQPRPETMNFEIPPIAIYSPVDDNSSRQEGKGDKLPQRRIMSMQAKLRTRSADDSEVNQKGGPSAEYKKFDGWPWAFGKKNRRNSMPLQRMVLSEVEEEKAIAEEKRSVLRRSKTSSSR